MITGRDAKTEMKKAQDILNDESASVAKKLKAIGKLVDIVLRVALNNRVNLVKIMEHLQVPKLKPEQRQDEK